MEIFLGRTRKRFMFVWRWVSVVISVIRWKHYHYPTPLDFWEYDGIMRCGTEKVSWSSIWSSNLNQPQATTSNLKQVHSFKFIHLSSFIPRIHSKNTFQEYIPRIHFNKSLNNLLTQTPFLFLIRLLDQHIDIWESGSKYWCKRKRN